MTPVLPMLAEACRSLAMALKKCPNGMYAEIKYDGERVQVHKEGAMFRYYSRSLKPVMEHKVWYAIMTVTIIGNCLKRLIFRGKHETCTLKAE